MNELTELRTIQQLSVEQGGVFGLDDLRAALAEPHRSALFRRVERLIEAGILARCTRGVYVAEEFDPAVLSQRIAPDSAISFETVLARALVIGPRPTHRIAAIRSGRPKTYTVRGLTVAHHHLSASLRFGEEVVSGVRYTVPEKAILDVLTFHLRGRRALFDVRTDVHLDRLDRDRLLDFLARYQNPCFVAFARDTLQLP